MGLRRKFALLAILEQGAPAAPMPVKLNVKAPAHTIQLGESLQVEVGLLSGTNQPAAAPKTIATPTRKPMLEPTKPSAKTKLEQPKAATSPNTQQQPKANAADSKTKQPDNNAAAAKEAADKFQVAAGDASKTIQAAGRVMSQATSGHGLLAMLLTNEEVAQNLRALIANLRSHGVLFYRDSAAKISPPPQSSPPPPRRQTR